MTDVDSLDTPNWLDASRPLPSYQGSHRTSDRRSSSHGPRATSRLVGCASFPPRHFGGQLLVYVALSIASLFHLNLTSFCSFARLPFHFHRRRMCPRYYSTLQPCRYLVTECQRQGIPCRDASAKSGTRS